MTSTPDLARRIAALEADGGAGDVGIILIRGALPDARVPEGRAWCEADDRLVVQDPGETWAAFTARARSAAREAGKAHAVISIAAESSLAG